MVERISKNLFKDKEFQNVIKSLIREMIKWVNVWIAEYMHKHNFGY